MAWIYSYLTPVTNQNYCSDGSFLGHPLRVFPDGNSFLVTDILRPGFSTWRVSMIDKLFVGIYLVATVIPGA